MAKLVGGALRLFATFFYLLDFLCAAGILGIYSYFLAKLNVHHLVIVNQWRAVEGLAGAAVVYTIFAVILTCFLGGLSVFAFIGMIFDLLFCGAMIAIAVLVREAAQTCAGTVRTPLGTGDVSLYGAGTNIGTACKLNLTVLIIACAGALFFLISFFMQLLVGRHHQKEKKYGPSPANDYTSGSGKKGGFFSRRRAKTTHEAYTKDAEATGATTTAGALTADQPEIRPSHDTRYTGTTMGQADGYTNKYDAAPTKYETHPTAHPTGTAVQQSATTTVGEGYYDPYARPTTGAPATSTNY